MTEFNRMTEEEKLQYACDLRHLSHEGIVNSSQRGSELSDEFNRLEVQIATITFAFGSFFVNSFTTTALINFNSLIRVIIQLTFIASIFCLLLSLVLGLLHIKRKEKFWDTVLQLRVARFGKWDEVVRRKSTFEQGHAFHKGTAIDGAPIVKSPNWTWILQTIFLGVGVALLFLLFMVLLFN